MKKVYYLSTCSTCKRIMADLDLSGFERQDIKTYPITNKQLEQMQKIAGSYELLFSRRSMKYKAWGLKEKKLTEDDYKAYILEEYTFLKRPVFVLNERIFIGNSASVIDDLKKVLNS